MEESSDLNIQENQMHDNKYSKEDAYKTLDMVNSWINNIDAKISYSLTFIGVLMGFFLTGNKYISLSKFINEIYCKKFKVNVLKEFVIGILALIFIGVSMTAIIYLYKAIKGRIDPSQYNQNGLITNSNIFWGKIASKSYMDFYNSINNLTDENLIKDISSQIFINSKICNEKILNYNKGIKYIIASVIMFFIFKIIGCMLC